MKHIFIINPTAGKTDSRQKIYDMAESLRQKHGLGVQCILTKKPTALSAMTTPP